jgi:hypothetical protein
MSLKNYTIIPSTDPDTAVKSKQRTLWHDQMKISLIHTDRLKQILYVILQEGKNGNGHRHPNAPNNNHISKCAAEEQIHTLTI